jgi:putative flippase GtrA
MIEANCRNLSSAFIRFLVVGASGTLLHYLILAIGLQLGGAALVFSQFGAVAGAAWNYFLVRVLSYGNSPHRLALPRFIAVAIGAIVLNGLCFEGLLQLGLGVWLCQILATALVVFWNFFVNHFWTFKVPRQ